MYFLFCFKPKTAPKIKGSKNKKLKQKIQKLITKRPRQRSVLASSLALDAIKSRAKKEWMYVCV